MIFNVHIWLEIIYSPCKFVPLLNLTEQLKYPFLKCLLNYSVRVIYLVGISNINIAVLYQDSMCLISLLTYIQS